MSSREPIDAEPTRYVPMPMEHTVEPLGPEIDELLELLARNAHDLWAKQRLSEGWTWGLERNDVEKTHPCLVPYEQLPDVEKEYDRTVVRGTLRSIVALGFTIRRSVCR